MKAFACISALIASACGAPLLGHGLAVHAPVLGHGVHGSVLGHGVHAPVVAHGVHGSVLGHGVHAPVVAHAVHAPVVAHAVHGPAYHAAPSYDTPSPYSYTYAVSDDYSKANFNAAESSDGAGNAEGSYSVALPDGRIQHVNYHANDYDGYVADVTYDGQAQYPEYHPTAPGYHGPALAHAVAHPAVHHAVHPVAHHAVHPVAHAVHPVAHHAAPLLATHAVAHPAVVGHHGLLGHGVAHLG